MDFVEAIPIAFKEITPNHNFSEKWKEIVLNTGILPLHNNILAFDY